VVRLDEADLGGSVRLNSFHDINYPTAMALGRTMGWDMPDEVAIWGIEMAVSDEFGEELTPVVADAVATVVQQVLAFLNSANAVNDERPGVP
jgi:Ni,Fe-hydrogenase maturation factor